MTLWRFVFCLVLGLTSLTPQLTAAESAPDSPAPSDTVKDIPQPPQPPQPIRTERFQVIPQVSIVSPTTMALRAGGTLVDYSGAIRGVPTFYGDFLARLGGWSGFILHGVGRIGYTRKEGRFNIAPSDQRARTDDVRLTWLSTALGLHAEYLIPGMAYMKPGLTAGFGGERISQSGATSGITGTSWLPYYYLSPTLTFLESNNGMVGDNWFGGFTFGITYQDSLDPVQVVRGWSFDLALNFHL